MCELLARNEIILAACAVPAERETLWTGISENVINFYRRRAAVLAVAA